MNRKSSAFGLLWTEGKQDTLAKDGIRALLLGLLVITLAVVAMVAVMPLADYEVSPGITAGFEAGLARWGVVAKLCAADNEGSSRSSSAKAYSPDEAFVRSVAVMGPSADGYVAAGPCTATSCTLSISPAEAYAQSLAQTDGSGAAQAVAPHEAFVRSVAVTGQNWAGYMAAGPCSAPFGTLSMGPAEAYAWGLAQTGAPGAAQAVAADEAFVRSVAVTGQSWAGYVAAGPCSAPFGTLSMGPAEAYAWGLAQTDGSGAAQAVPADEAFVRSVAVTGQSWAGYVAAGPCSAPLDTLAMSATEAAAYAHSLARALQASVGLD